MYLVLFCLYNIPTVTEALVLKNPVPIMIKASPKNIDVLKIDKAMLICPKAIIKEPGNKAFFALNNYQ